MSGIKAAPRMFSTSSSLTHETAEEVSDFGSGSSSFVIEAEKVESTYDTWASNYDEETDELGFASPEACAKTIMNIPWQPGYRFLDVGCGTGTVGKICRRLGLADCSMDGMDASKGMLDVLQAAPESVYESVWQHNMLQMPWPPESKAYDSVVCSGVLIYINDPEVLEEFARVTKKGGHCSLMFRTDCYHVFKAKADQMVAEGRWALDSSSEPQKNFPNAPESSPSSNVFFFVHTYKVLV